MGARRFALASGALALSLLVSLAGAATGQPYPVPSGDFEETAFGPVSLNCLEKDLFCIGTYGKDDATRLIYLTGVPEEHYRSDGQWKFTGYWAETQSDQPCAEVNHFPGLSTNAWGRVEFLFNADLSGWTGKWGYCDTTPAQAWNGKKLNLPARNRSYTCTAISGDSEGRLKVDLMDGLMQKVSVDLNTRSGRKVFEFSCNYREDCKRPTEWIAHSDTIELFGPSWPLGDVFPHSASLRYVTEENFSGDPFVVDRNLFRLSLDACHYAE